MAKRAIWRGRLGDRASLSVIGRIMTKDWRRRNSASGEVLEGLKAARHALQTMTRRDLQFLALELLDDFQKLGGFRLHAEPPVC